MDATSVAVIITYMRKSIGIICFAGLVVAAVLGWQIGACIVANLQLREDMQDMSSQLGSRVGYSAAKSDDDFREAILRNAQQHGIDLSADQITVRRSGPDEKELYLAADYTRQVRMAGITLRLHFAPEAGTK